MNKISRVPLLFIILVLVIGTIGCRDTFNSEWKNDTIVIDGYNKDWNNHGKYFLEDVGMSFGITNDADSLYFLMQFRDVKTHKMFTRNGATIWFCQDGKKDKKLGYKYYGEELIAFKDQPQMRPLQGMGQTSNMPQNFGGRPGGNDMMGGKRDNSEHYNKILVVDGDEEIFESLKEDGPTGPHASCSYSEGVFVYELAFPLKQEYSYSLDITPGQEVLVCIDFPPAMPSNSSSRGGGPGGGGPGGGGPGGGGPGGGMGGPPGGGGGGGGGMPPSGGMGGGPGGGPGGDGPGGGETNLKPRTMWFSLQLAPEAE